MKLKTARKKEKKEKKDKVPIANIIKPFVIKVERNVILEFP